MEKKMIKKLLAIMMIIAILATDFFTLGSSLITYATQVTNEIVGYPNIHFSTYFKEGENEEKQINKSIRNDELKLYAKIGVNSDVDCLEDIQIKLKGNNFNIISSNKGTLEGNTVKLDYIAAGSLVELELNIAPVFTNKISADMLLKTEIELNAKYKYADAPKGEDITATSEAIVKYVPDGEIGSELEADIITNKVFAVKDTNKRIIQALIKSKLTNNEYPVKQTTLNVSIPSLGDTAPEISVLAIGKLATNGQTEIKNMTTENGNVQITLNNEIDENNQVSWIKNAFDEIVVTYIYPETVDASKVEITANSEIKLQATENTYTATYTKGIENQEPDNVIMERTEITTEEMYKGPIYANVESQYATKTSMIITNSDVADEVTLHEGPDMFGTPEGDLPINTKYITTKINLEKMLSILGQDGNLEIKNGEIKTIINKDSSVDADGNVVINYENSTSELAIKTSRPVNAGVLEINHIKAITTNEYTREQLKTVTELKTTGTNNKSSINLKETISNAELTIDRTALSATEANELTLGIKLITDGVKYDLYKNPSITIKFPETVANVEFIDEPNKLYADEFEITNKSYNPANHTMTINMAGEQTKYPESSVTQSYIQLKLKVTVLQFVISQTDKITMTYKNENASQHVGGATNGVVEQLIEISAPSELIKMFNISSNTNTSRTEKILQQVKKEETGKDFNFDIVLINNKDTDMSNIKILGKLPTEGNTISKEINTLETKFKNIVTENATIYYTENSNATEDIEKAENGWTENLTENAKMYLIKLDNLARGAKFTATVNIQMPNSITENAISYTEYEVIYDTELDTNIKENSRTIGLISSLAASLKVETTAQVCKDDLKNGDAVKEGEVIKYTVTVKNNGIETLKNVKLNLDIPEGTVFVQPIEKYIANEGTENEEIIEKGGYVYTEDSYYEEITDSEKLSKVTHITIPELSTSTPYVIEYEVRINKGTANTEISNKTIVTYNDSTIEAEEIKNIIKEANIRVTIKRAVDESIQLLPKGNSRYIAYVENLSDSKIKNLEMQIISKGFNVENINDNEKVDEETKIKEIKPKTNSNKKREEDYENGIKSFIIYGDIEKAVREMSICAIVKDSEGTEYRSNMVIETIPYVNGTIDITSPQNGKYIKEGDTVEYNIIAKNTSDVESIIKISNRIPEYLQVQSIYENRELKLQKTDSNSISNNINYSTTLNSQEETQVDIVAKVGAIPELYNGKTITDMATIKVSGVEEANSQIITHILKSSSVEDKNIENVISGIAWFDANSNGRRDVDEDVLPEIGVKLYDTVAKQYLTDKDGNIIETITDVNGEYTFTKIPDGSYLIIFEYDTEKYEFTTSFAEGVDTLLNSKVVLKCIDTSERQIRVAAIEVNLNENVFNMNIGLKKNTGKTPKEEQPGITEKSEENKKPEDSNKPENTEPTNSKKTISGFTWLDSNRNGQKDDNEKLLSGINVKIYNVITQKYITETTTDDSGKYTFSDIEKGSYIIIFEYNTEDYEPTSYMAEGVDTARNSKAVLNKININGQEVTVAVTDTINVQNDVGNINMGLKEKLIFDLELNKYISKIVVQTSEKTKTYDYDGKTLAKTEIHKKQLQGAIVVLEYTIKVKNNGEIAGYARNVVDYLPSGLTFSSELNKDWYLSGNYLYTKSLENVEIKPGEEKEVKLVLTKTMTSNNVGLINNRAEIYQDYNKYGETDIDSTPNNQAPNEDDFGSVDVIIQVATGGSDIAYMTLLMINLVLIGFAIKLMIRRRIIKIPSRKWRR